MNNSYGEWWVAYHGAGRISQSDEEIKRNIHNITVDDFMAGQNQFYYDVNDHIIKHIYLYLHVLCE